MIVDMESNKKLSPIVTLLFLRGRNFNILLVFISQSYFKVPKIIRLTTIHFLIMKIPHKREFKQIESFPFSGIDFNDFMKLYKYYTKESYSFLVNDKNLSSDDPLQFGKNLL